MNRKWKGLPKRFSEGGVATLTVVGATTLGTISIIPILAFSPDLVAGGWTWVWLMVSFLTSLSFGLMIARPLVRRYRSLHGELVLCRDTLNVRWEHSGQEIVLDLNEPVDVDACWFADANQIRGSLQAKLRQNGQTFTLYASNGTAQAGARLGIPKRRPSQSPWHRRVRLHPIHLAEILELVQIGPHALCSPLDAPQR